LGSLRRGRRPLCARGGKETKKTIKNLCSWEKGNRVGEQGGGRVREKQQEGTRGTMLQQRRGKGRARGRKGGKQPSVKRRYKINWRPAI